MHVGTVFCSCTEASDVELAELFLLRQLNVMTEVTVVTLMTHLKAFSMEITHVVHKLICNY